MAASKLTAEKFSNFWKLCKKLSLESSYNMKTSIIRNYIEKKSNDSGILIFEFYLLYQPSLGSMKFDAKVCYAGFHTHAEAVKNISPQRHANAEGVPMYSSGFGVEDPGKLSNFEK